MYDQTSLARRRLLHHRVAEALLAAARAGASRRVGGRGGGAPRAAGGPRRPRRRALPPGRRPRPGGVRQRRRPGALRRRAGAWATRRSPSSTRRSATCETLDGRFADAVASYERAAARVGADDVARIEGKLGGVHQRRGQWSTAEQHYQEALARPRRRRPAGRPSPPHRRPRHHRAPAGRHRSRRPRSPTRRSRWRSEAGDDAALAHTGTVAGPPGGRPGRPRRRSGAARGELRAGRPARRSRRPGGRGQRARPGRADGGRPRTRPGPARRTRSRCASSIGDRHREAALRDQLAQVLHGLGRHDGGHGRAEAGGGDLRRHRRGGRFDPDRDLAPERMGRPQQRRPLRNDPGTLGRDNARVAADPAARRGP